MTGPAPISTRAVAVAIALVVTLLLTVVAMRFHIHAVEAQYNTTFQRDAFGNPWHPDFTAWNARIERIGRWSDRLLWGGVLPANVMLTIVVMRSLFHKRSAVAFVGALVAALVGFVLFSAFMATATPVGMIG